MDRALTYDLNQQVNVLELQKTDATYSWKKRKTIWCRAEPKAGKNLFSTVGIGAKSVKFTIWKQNITLHNAFRWKDKFCFLTDLMEVDHMYYEVMAALVEPRTCELMQTGETIDPGLHRPIYLKPTSMLTFPACMVEKYAGFSKLTPQSKVSESYVLVTPKEITLSLADLVKVDGVIYGVQVVHNLDEFKNEYEIAATKET